jgi:hypothetical protein
VDEKSSADDFDLRGLAPVAEIGCWTAVALAPFLRWINGPAVSTDQFVVQIALVTMALGGAVGLRLYNWRRNRTRPPGWS